MADITAVISQSIEKLRSNMPLVHCITNYVTVNDVANALLAIGASPIMADDIREVSDITAISSALVINIGTLNERTVQSMLEAGKTANKNNIPVVLDPVGAGASQFRNYTVKELLKEVQINVIRGNLSEVSYIAGLKVNTKGVDTALADSCNNPMEMALMAANKYNCTVGITGAVDVVTDGNRVVQISNGVTYLSKVTGTGCMTTALVGAFMGAGVDSLTATIAGICSMGIAGEISYEKYNDIGTGTFHMGIIDALSRLNTDTYIKRAKLNEKES
ncbi:MAG TPA: hydroxyethylthiazole kinase [Clostridiales bacterium]|nr:hydroxyethylthiazole kinase [Clostridiales bacterium]